MLFCSLPRQRCLQVQAPGFTGTMTIMPENHFLFTSGKQSAQSNLGSLNSARAGHESLLVAIPAAAAGTAGRCLCAAARPSQLPRNCTPDYAARTLGVPLTASPFAPHPPPPPRPPPLPHHHHPAESVNEGHPDKLCDQVSDAILDACLKEDPESKVACESATKTNMVMVFGEITTRAKVDYEAVVRKTCRDIGFISDDVGLDADKCKVLVHIEEQSPDIGQGVHGMGTKTLEEIGAGDQVRPRGGGGSGGGGRWASGWAKGVGGEWHCQQPALLCQDRWRPSPPPHPLLWRLLCRATWQ